MRLRTDCHPWEAAAWRAILNGARQDPRIPSDVRWSEGWPTWLDRHEPMADGDVWPVRCDPDGPGSVSTWLIDSEPSWQTEGYWLWCPITTCEWGGHPWTHARPGDDTDCPRSHGKGPCKTGGPSCWQWSGSVDDGTLTARPSLMIIGACNFHGFLTNGTLA